MFIAAGNAPDGGRKRGCVNHYAAESQRVILFSMFPKFFARASARAGVVC